MAWSRSRRRQRRGPQLFALLAAHRQNQDRHVSAGAKLAAHHDAIHVWQLRDRESRNADARDRKRRSRRCRCPPPAPHNPATAAASRWRAESTVHHRQQDRRGAHTGSGMSSAGSRWRTGIFDRENRAAFWMIRGRDPPTLDRDHPASDRQPQAAAEGIAGSIVAAIKAFENALEVGWRNAWPAVAHPNLQPVRIDADVDRDTGSTRGE